MKDDKVGSRHVDQHLLGFYRSRRFKAWLVPTRFFAGRLKVCVNPWGPATEVNWDIPSELAAFTPHTYPQLSKPNPVSPSTRGSRPKPGAIFKPDWLSPVWPFMPFVLALLICIGILWGQIFISADPQETRIQTGENNMAIRGLWPDEWSSLFNRNSSAK